jgi:HK97 family phage portal protein
MSNWLKEKAFQVITGMKHQDFRTLTTLQHNDLVNGNLTTLGYGDSAGQSTDNKLLNEGYEKNAQAYSIIRKISEAGSDIPWKPQEINNKGEAIDITEGKFYDFVMQPNPDQTQKDLKENSFTNFLTTGDLFWSIPEIIGFKGPRELNTLPSQLIEILTDRNAPLIPTGYQFELNQFKERYTTEEIIHLKYINPSTKGIESLRGLSPLAAAWLVLSGDNQRAEAQESMMKNGGAKGFFTNESDQIMSNEDRDIQQGLLDRMLGGAKNYNRVLVGKSKGKFHQLGMSSNDLKILDTGIHNLRALCNVYGAPSELFNDPANKISSNQKVGRKLFYENAVLPVDRRLLSTYNNGVVRGWSEQDGKEYKVVQDLSSIGALQEDANEKAARAEKVTNSIIKVVAQMNQGLSPEAAATIISHTQGISEDDAKNFVILRNKTEGNEQEL